MNGGASTRIEPDRGSHGFEGTWPAGTQPTGAEMGLGLSAALAPGRPHRSPSLPAYRTDDPAGVALAQQGVTQQALRRKEKLLDCGAKHAARVARRRA